MFTSRFFNLIVAAVLMIVVALSVQQAFARKAIVPKTSAVYTESNEQALNEYQRGERYGEIPSDVAQFSAEQILPELMAPVRSIDLTDYYFRQQVLKSTVKAGDLTDYFFRHPELPGEITRTGDMTDYYFRHSGN